MDDNPTNIDALVDTLRLDYRLGVVKSGPRALAFIDATPPDLILLDVMMPGMDGFEVCTRIKGASKTQGIPIIFITAMKEPSQITQGFKVGAVDYITKPFHAAEVSARIRTHLSLVEMREALNAQNLLLEERVREKTAALEDMLNATIRTMAMAVEIRDPYTAGHQVRVAALGCAIAKKMGFSGHRIDTVHYAGLLHDLGKIRIPAAIINRPGKLLQVEREIINIHPQVGYDLLKNIPFPWPIAEIVYQHHEKMDGSGYPRGLSGNDILMEARIIGVADLVEAESSHRPYRPTMGMDSALREIETHRGTRYDSTAVDACLSLFRDDKLSLDDLATGCTVEING